MDSRARSCLEPKDIEVDLRVKKLAPAIRRKDPVKLNYILTNLNRKNVFYLFINVIAYL